MDVPKVSMRVALLASLASVFAIGFFAASDGPVSRGPVIDESGAPFAVPTVMGAHWAFWEGTPIVVFLVPGGLLAGVEEMRGEGSATDAIEVPGSPGLRLFALSAKSTHLGCTVGFNPELGASKDILDYDADGLADGRMLDPCHMGQWDPYHKGEPVHGPAPIRLAALEISVRNGYLWGSGFDGPVGPA